jgi:hypothetical protein
VGTHLIRVDDDLGRVGLSSYFQPLLLNSTDRFENSCSDTTRVVERSRFRETRLRVHPAWWHGTNLGSTKRDESAAQCEADTWTDSSDRRALCWRGREIGSTGYRDAAVVENLASAGLLHPSRHDVDVR